MVRNSTSNINVKSKNVMQKTLFSPTKEACIIWALTILAPRAIHFADQVSKREEGPEHKNSTFCYRLSSYYFSFPYRNTFRPAPQKGRVVPTTTASNESKDRTFSVTWNMNAFIVRNSAPSVAIPLQRQHLK